MDIIFEEQTEGTVARFSRWLVAVGDQVDAHAPIAELETDKVTVEIAAPESGRISELLVEPEQEINPGTVMARIDAEGAAAAPADVAVEVIFSEDHAEGTVAKLSRWLVAEGRRVAEHDALLEVETDKVTVEIAAPASGILAEVRAREGADLEPGQVVGIIASGQGPRRTEPHIEQEPVPAEPVVEDGISHDLISPSVRRLMRKNNLTSLAGIRGTGAGGRVTRDDVLTWLEQPARPPEEALQPSELGGNIVPHSSMRRAIASHMAHSLQVAPHVTSVFEADLSRIIAHRENNKGAFAEQGVKLTFTAYFLAASAAAMKAVPQVNARYHPDHLEIFDQVNIGVGTALGDEGLIVPVIENVQDRSLLEIARELEAMTDRARVGKLGQEDLKNGTFTISNHGVSGSLLASPIIINQPQVAILGIGKLERRLKVVEADGKDKIRALPMCYVTLSIDHRALDAFQTNRWLSAFVGLLESWEE